MLYFKETDLITSVLIGKNVWFIVHANYYQFIISYRALCDESKE